jgi:hypothetical protein
MTAETRDSTAHWQTRAGELKQFPSLSIPKVYAQNANAPRGFTRILAGSETGNLVSIVISRSKLPHAVWRNSMIRFRYPARSMKSATCILGFVGVSGATISCSNRPHRQVLLGSQQVASTSTSIQVRRLQHRAETVHELATEEVASLVSLSAAKDWEVQVRALSALACVRGNGSESVAIRAASARIHDPEGIVRQYALRTLEIQHDPRLASAALLLKDDPHEYAREKARRILRERRLLKP